MITLNDELITPTIFPDKTSQVWKIPEHLYNHGSCIIVWDFENESELIQVLQLVDLMNSNVEKSHRGVKLVIPYLPYARQDKGVSNSSTFALTTFLNILYSYEGIDSIASIDVHNPKLLNKDLHTNRQADLRRAISVSKPNLICFPDKGASERGYNVLDIPSFNLMKKRNQLTGEIEGLTTELPLSLSGQRVLIVDDLCDAGGTFIAAKKLLDSLGVLSVSLYTTHGLYTKGLNILTEAGFDYIINYKGVVHEK
jgi:ribose-phosphate pyrophosphokinase